MSTPYTCSNRTTVLAGRTFKPDEWPKKKTVDIGQNGVTVSADPFGGIYQISCSIQNNQYGMMIAAPWKQFDQKHRQRADLVREYRKHMERRLEMKEPGLGLRLDIAKGHTVIRHVKHSLGSHVQIEYRSRDKELFVQTALKVANHRAITQAMQVTNLGSQNRSILVSLDLSFAVSRASYGQLTDQGSVPMPDPTNSIYIREKQIGLGAEAHSFRIVSIDNDSLRARLSAFVIFYNSTKKQYMDVDHVLFPATGRDCNPPSMLRRVNSQCRRSQTIHIGPFETVQLGCVILPEDVTFADHETKLGPSMLLWSHDAFDANKVLNAELFAHVVGIYKPQIVVNRHVQRLKSSDPISKPDTIESRIVWANLDYILGCCSIPIFDRHLWAVIPDHIALPLGWPRDNYWQLRLLNKFHTSDGFHDLFQEQLGNAQKYSKQIQFITRGHLEWLFKLATTEGQFGKETRHFWRRSYLINGQPKDGAVYQLDTQLYPFLQLCDYYKDLGKSRLLENEHVEFVRSIIGSETFRNVLVDIIKTEDSDIHLFKTDETPADDDTTDFPFHLSSNILVRYTMVRLAELLRETKACSDVPPSYLEKLGERVAKGIMDHLVCKCGDGSEQQMFAYALNPTKPKEDPSRHRRYHDGNDMPTLFGPEWWSTCMEDAGSQAGGKPWEGRALWEKTMEWAFTPDPNWTVDPTTRSRTCTLGYNSGYAGNGSEPFHGLGSDHSEGAWVLGFFQEWKYARMVGDKGREARAWAKIKGSMQWDGTFSEAVGVHDGKCTSKTWFSWPGAMIAAELIDEIVVSGERAESEGHACE